MAATLAQSLAAGDPEAFAALYDRLAVRLLGAARTMTGSTAEAEDVVQDLFVELARGRARLAAVADLEAYVFTMLRNAVHRRGRRVALDRRAVLAIAEGRRGSGGFIDTATELPDDELAAAMAALPDKQREVVALKIDAGLTSPEPRIVAQARAAGIDFPVELVAASGPAREASSRAAISNLLDRRHEAWRLRALLTGDL